MPISWFPGHMNKARKELGKLVSASDLIIEILDARIPNASRNPLLVSLTTELPRILILNKADLADPATTRAWQSHFQHNAVHCVPNSMHDPMSAESLLAKARGLVQRQSKTTNSMQIVIAGIPNVGKSTFINSLVGRKVTKTGNEPAITKGQQRIKLDTNVYLIDTPGLLWPKLEDQAAAYKLAALGTIRNTAIDVEDVAWFAAEYLLINHKELLIGRYSIDKTVDSAEQFFESAGSATGAIGKGGNINYHKVSETLLNDLRSGKLGPLSLETPL